MEKMMIRKDYRGKLIINKFYIEMRASELIRPSSEYSDMRQIF